MLKRQFVKNANQLQASTAFALRRLTFSILATTSMLYVVTGYAGSCTVIIQEYEKPEQRSGECFIDDATNTVIVYDAEYWGKRGRKLLVPRSTDGRKAASFIAISPTDVRSNEVAHAMRYHIVIKTRKGLYKYEGTTPTRTYQANTPPSLWARQRPDQRMDFTNKLTTAEMLAELQTLKPEGPALDAKVVEQVMSLNQSLVDRLPTLAGINSEASPIVIQSSNPSLSSASQKEIPAKKQVGSGATTSANTLDARVNRFHEEIKGLCPLMRASPSPQIHSSNWYINYDAYQANRLSSLSDSDLYGKLTKFWIANTHECALKYKGQLNIVFFDGSASKVAMHDVGRWQIVPKSMLNQFFENDFSGRVRKSTQCRLESLYGNDVRQWPGYAKDPLFPSPYRFMGAPITLFDDSLKYMLAVRKVFDDPAGMFNAKSRGLHEQQVEGEKAKLEAAIKLFECTKSEGYPFAAENTVAVGNIDPLARTYRVVPVNDIPLTQPR